VVLRKIFGIGIDTDCGLESDSDSEVLRHPWISVTASTVTRSTDAESVG